MEDAVDAGPDGLDGDGDAPRDTSEPEDSRPEPDSLDETSDAQDYGEDGPSSTCDEFDGPCTTGVWDGATCVAEPKGEGTACDDLNACTEDDACDGAGACTGAPLVCNDSNPCTKSACDPTLGCSYTPESDGGSCGTSKICVGASCVEWPPGMGCDRKPMVAAA